MLKNFIIAALLLSPFSALFAAELIVSFPSVPTTDMAGSPSRASSWVVYANGNELDRGIPIDTRSETYVVDEYGDYAIQVALVNDMGMGELSPATTVTHEQPRGLPRQPGAPMVRLVSSQIVIPPDVLPPVSSIPFDLSGYGILFAYQWPIAPIISSSATVTPATLAANNVNGRQLTLSAGDYGDVSPANDQTWILLPGARIREFNYTGSARVAVYCSIPRDPTTRIIRFLADEGSQDILFDGIYIDGDAGYSAGSHGNNLHGIRTAVVNSVIQTPSYGIFNSILNPALNYGQIIAGNYIFTSTDVPYNGSVGNQHGMRLMSPRQTIVAGNYVFKNGGGQLIRIHTQSQDEGLFIDAEDLYIGDNIIVNTDASSFAGGIMLQPASSGYVPNNIRRAVIEDNESHLARDSLIALQAAWAANYEAITIDRNDAFGSLGLPGNLAPYDATATGNTQQPYNAGNIPTPFDHLGWTPQ